MQANEALAHLEAGHRDLATEAVERIDAEGLWERLAAVFDPATESNSKSVLSETVVIGEAAAQVRATDLLRRVTGVLEPFADRCATVGGVVSFLGAVSHYLGVMEAALGHRERATEHFAHALATYRRLGADGWARVTHHAIAAFDGETSSLRRVGNDWTLSYLGTTARVRDAKGVGDLAELLSRPGQDVAAVDLMTGGDIAAMGADAVFDAPAREAYRRRLADLDAELAEAEDDHDLGRIDKVRTEREALAHELTAALGLGGRSRALGDPAERARKAVTARIRDSIERITAVHPELGQHQHAAQVRDDLDRRAQPVSALRPALRSLAAIGT